MIISDLSLSNILLITGIIFSAFLGLTNTCKFLNVRFAVWSVISEDNISSQHQDGCHKTETRFNQTRCGKAKKYNSAFCAAGAAGDKGTTDSLLNTKYLIHEEKFRRPPNFPLFSCGPSETICPTLGTNDLDGRQTE
jgi:hypothetical protein